MFNQIDDTIVAISSPPGIGPRGIIRASGPLAIALAAEVFTCDDGTGIAQLGGHQRRSGWLRLNVDTRVPAEAYIFRTPASYTRQDLVELHTIGSPPVLAMVLDDLVAHGGRHAEPGEFTGRAFLLGGMDLTRVEGVAAIIHAQTDAQLRASEVLLHGSLGRQTRRMRDELADLLASIEAEIDFADEPIEFAAPAQVLDALERIAAAIDEILAQAGSAERLDVLPRIVLAGLPNAGKSTLFNRLTGMDRAIQSAIAGTTRDVIAAPIRLPGGEVMLCDTAGMNPISSSAAGNQRGALLEEEIQHAASRAVSSANLVLLVIDACDSPAEAVSAMLPLVKGRPTHLVMNKMDLLEDQRASLAAVKGCEFPLLACVSAHDGSGVEELRSRMGQIVSGSADMQGASVLSLSMRQRGALQDASESLSRARVLQDTFTRASAHPELIAMEIRHAVHALSLLLGEVTSDDILTRIFSRFCIGK